MLNVILKRAGVITGPRIKNTSHSGMEYIKRDLLGLPQFEGGENFLKFGNALHEVFLENDRSKHFRLLPIKEKNQIEGMVRRLNANPVVTSLMRDSIREHKFYIRLNKIKVAVVLDARQPLLKRGFDLKTTSCTTQSDFENKIITLGYIKQGITYKLAAKLKNFYFVGVSKIAPYNIFIVDIDAKQFQAHYRYSEMELKFLLYFYKHYGKTKIKRK